MKSSVRHSSRPQKSEKRESSSELICSTAAHTAEALDHEQLTVHLSTMFSNKEARRL